MSGGAPRDREPRDEPPPLLGSWPAVYAALLIYLLALILLLAWFTKALS
jgi:hypothetical protein